MSALSTTKTAVPGVELIYLDDRDLAGININGIARMLDCHSTTVSNVIKGVNITEIEELPIQTGGGVQGVKFVFEVGFIKLLKAIRHSKRIDDVTRQNAEDVYDRFAEAGFKLFTMMNTAPEALKEKIDRESGIESDVSPELADSFRKTEWVIRKALELGTSAEEVQKIFLNFESAKPKPKPDRTPNAAIKIKEVSVPKSPHYHLVKEWFAECLEFDRDSSVQMGADRDIPSQLYGSFSRFLINKGCDQQVSHAAFSATLKEFVGLEIKSNPSIRFKSPNNKRTLYGVRLR